MIEWTEADVIRKLRAETRIKLKDLKRLSGVSTSAINRIEKGHTDLPMRQTLTAIASVFGLTEEELWAAVPRKHPGVRVRVDDALLAEWRQSRKRRRQRRPAAVGE